MAKGDGLAGSLAASLAAFRSERGGEAVAPAPPVDPSSSRSDDACDPGAAVDHAEDFEERAAILDYDQGLSRKEAERIARSICGVAPD